MKRKAEITSIDYNWWHSDVAEEYESHTVGEHSLGKMVDEILDFSDESVPCYKVIYENGDFELIFRPNKVYFTSTVEEDEKR